MEALSMFALHLVAGSSVERGLDLVDERPRGEVLVRRDLRPVHADGQVLPGASIGRRAIFNRRGGRGSSAAAALLGLVPAEFLLGSSLELQQIGRAHV